METNHDELLYVTLLLGLILPKHSRTKKIAFGNKYKEVMKQKLSFFFNNDVQKIWWEKGKAFLPKNTVLTLKHGGSLMMFWGCFSSRKTGQLIAIWGIMKSEDYIKILGENLQLST